MVLISVKSSRLFVLSLKLYVSVIGLIKLNLTGYWCLKENPYRFLLIPVFFMVSLNCFARIVPQNKLVLPV